jgi:hypothetical protein
MRRFHHLGAPPARARMARSVPSGMSPGWFGIVVYRFKFGLNQISCDQPPGDEIPGRAPSVA